MNILNILALSGLFNGIGALLLGCIALRYGKTALHRLFALLNLAIAIWALSYWRWLPADNYETALFWARMLSIGSTLIPIFFLHWILALIGSAKKYRAILTAGYIMTAIFLIFSFSPYFVKTVEPTFAFLYWPKPGILYHFYVVFAYITLLGYGIYRLFVAYKTATGSKKTQMKYVFLGLAIAAPAGFSNFFLWYNINIPPYLNFIVLTYIGCYTYAIIWYQLMDIKIVVKKSTVYLTTLFLASGIGFAIMYFFPELSILALMVSAISFGLLKKAMDRIANKFFFVSLYNAQKTLSDISKRLTTVVSLKQLANLIIDTIVKTMQIDRAALLLRKDPGFSAIKIIGFEELNNLSFVKDDVLTQHLAKHPKALIREELPFVNLEHLKDNMEKIRADLILPLIFKDRLIGMIVLGSKLSRDAYTREDVILLESMANQAGVAVENAELYFNMEKKVKEQTKDIEEALEARSEFLNLASHQLRTPVSGIRGALSMILDGDTTPKQTQQFLKDCYANVNRLLVIIKDILDAQVLASRGLKLMLAPAQIEDMLEESLKMFELRAKEKDIYIRFEKPEQKLPMIKIDRARLKGAIDDLIDNAVHYTVKGGITIKLKIENLKFKIIIADTGIGITKEEIPHLFKKFNRGRGGKTLNVNSSGLGLFIAKSIIELHKGTVELYSEGENKGTRFTISLPMGE